MSEEENNDEDFLFSHHKDMDINPAYVEDEETFEIMKDYLHYGTEDDWARLNTDRESKYIAKYGDIEDKFDQGCERCRSVEWEHILLDSETKKDIVLCERCYAIQMWDVL